MGVDVIEMDLKSGEPTGLILTFDGPTERDAAQQALAYARTRDGRARLGKTGLVVYPHGVEGRTAWVSPARPADAVGRERAVVDDGRRKQLVWVRKGSAGGSYQ